MNALILFASTFIMVFFLGIQQLLVQGDHKVLVFFNSFLIGMSQLFLYKFAPDASGFEIAAYLSGGPFGVVSAMYFFQWAKPKFETFLKGNP